MRILLMYERCEIGGVESAMVSLGGALHERGHECEFFFLRRGPMEHYLPAGCPAHFGDMAACLALVRSRRFDIVHVCNTGWGDGMSSASLSAAKLVVTAFGMVVPAWNSTNCDAFTAGSLWLAQECQPFIDLPVRFIYNGIDHRMFRPAPAVETTSATPIVAWVGNGTTEYKRIDRLAQVAPLLRQAGVRLWIAGANGPREVAQTRPAIAEILRETVEFWDEVAGRDLPAFYRNVAASGGCILSTSDFEGFGLALAEAQACGCPVIGTDVKGVNEVVRPGHGGVLYASCMSPRDLMTLILGTIADSEKMSRRRVAAIEMVRQRFSLQSMADAYVRVYEETRAAPRRRSARLRAQMWFAPCLDWKGYKARRWRAGQNLYKTSQRLAELEEWRLASSVARHALVTFPTQFRRPGRLAHFVACEWRSRFSAAPSQ